MLKLVEIVILWVYMYYTIIFGFSLFRHFWGISFQLLKVKTTIEIRTFEDIFYILRDGFFFCFSLFKENIAFVPLHFLSPSYATVTFFLQGLGHNMHNVCSLQGFALFHIKFSFCKIYSDKLWIDGAGFIFSLYGFIFSWPSGNRVHRRTPITWAL